MNRKSGRAMLIAVTAIAGIWTVVSQVASQSMSPHAINAETVSSIRQTQTKPPETVVLGEKAALGKVTFSHLNHTTKNQNIEGIRPAYCIECHHVEQPEAEAKKMSPHQTAFPADRTTTLTADLLAKEPNTRVTPCRSCHARKDEKPALWPRIPEIKSEDSTALITVTNQQAFHRTCAGCHDQAVKARPDVKAPTSKKCTACHKKSAA